MEFKIFLIAILAFQCHKANSVTTLAPRHRMVVRFSDRNIEPVDFNEYRRARRLGFSLHQIQSREYLNPNAAPANAPQPGPPPAPPVQPAPPAPPSPPQVAQQMDAPNGHENIPQFQMRIRNHMVQFDNGRELPLGEFVQLTRRQGLTAQQIRE